MPKTTKSPTQRTMAQLRKEGCELVQITEHWNGWGKCRQDLFGFVDVLAIVNGVTVGIQVTTGGNMSKRIDKIRYECFDAFKTLCNAGWRIEVHGWRKLKATGRWEQRKIELSLSGFGETMDLNPIT